MLGAVGRRAVLLPLRNVRELRARGCGVRPVAAGHPWFAHRTFCRGGLKVGRTASGKTYEDVFADEDAGKGEPAAKQPAAQTERKLIRKDSLFHSVADEDEVDGSFKFKPNRRHVLRKTLFINGYEVIRPALPALLALLPSTRSVPRPPSPRRARPAGVGGPLYHPLPCPAAPVPFPRQADRLRQLRARGAGAPHAEQGALRHQSPESELQ